MALSSSSSNIRRYHVFPSFHGPDVRKGFLSHLHYHFASKGITTFKDQEIEKGNTIGPELVNAIRESRVSIVLLSKKYASSSWCLDELVEILKCKEDQGQIVMTIFYDVDPSSVRKQKGDFGSTFMKTCEGKSEEVKQRWTKALTHVANIKGEHSLNWANEADMIQKIATDVSTKLSVTPSRDFEGMVGLEAHLTKLNSLLCFEGDDVKMIGIWGPAGIGKSTIARALYNQLSSSFQLKCFMGNLKGSLKSIVGVDHYEFQKSLQKLLLAKILNQGDMRVHNLAAIKEWLQDQRVLIILDDVDDLEQLEVLAKELSWFGSGSRIIVATEDKKILKEHGINDIYHVDFPSMEEALEILCLSAFKQSSVPDGFEELAKKVVHLCGNLPLGLSIVGSSLRGESKHEWELQLPRIEASLDGKIESILKVGYERLSKKNQSLFLHIACFFNYRSVDYVTVMLADSNLDVRNGLKTLADKCFVHISINGWIVMHHHLLQQLGRQIVLEQSDEPGKRQFLIEAEEIRAVLTDETGTGSVIGISYNTSNIGEVSVSKGAFEGMRNLRFLRIFNYLFSGKCTLQIPEDMEYLPPLRLLHWDRYPRKSLPTKFQPERLLELHMPHSNLEKLWGGIQPLPNIKSIDLSFSIRLKEIPNLSNATNLETLNLTHCKTLVELPSSISNLHKLKKLKMSGCEKLRVIPTNINLASLEVVRMNYCSRLRRFPDISSNIKTLSVGNTKIENFPPSVAGSWSRLARLEIGSRSLKILTHAPQSIISLNLSNSDIRRIPDCVISLPYLVELIVENCRKLVTIPALPPWLESLNANKCASLKRVCCSFGNPTILTFYNCLKLDEEARRGIIMQQPVDEYICLPGKEIPAEFSHKAVGNSITIPLAPGTFLASSRYKACFVILPVTGYRCHSISCIVSSKAGFAMRICDLARLSDWSPGTEHLFIFHGRLVYQRNMILSEIIFKFNCVINEFSDDPDLDNMIIECGVQIMTEEAKGSSSSDVDNFETKSSSSELENFETESSSSELDIFETESSSSEADYYEDEGLKFSQVESTKTSKHTSCWSWFTKHGLRKKKMNKTRANSRGIS
ncbi:disease resistance protein-like [Arabidopsis thaliana]|uniref:ADP-ribosyl cyclase/cyclic ADP-ribose hydrolase n=1 Tax=Arabidopsis thaliana TaxID=3702 RepID=Q9FFS5_ARATH|nr:Disease resistance protein (TIR-NBS-LRR class) family [Arabidopsis thaliana]AED94691.1 Disease resistance protein (TIR-NBS-LRR class) family [Arabidopsis thaliana]BAB11461.1 disease resistance protein-like [Arabidopsis thaliana]|eukprot:NP_198970.1 Disease resistance protein (TIR-NBS-LRR class) family [Arabidopsis thaliana]